MNGADQRSGGDKPAVGGRSGQESAPAPPDRFREPCDVSPGRDWRAGTPSPGRRHAPLRLPDGTARTRSWWQGGALLPGTYRPTRGCKSGARCRRLAQGAQRSPAYAGTYLTHQARSGLTGVKHACLDPPTPLHQEHLKPNRRVRCRSADRTFSERPSWSPSPHCSHYHQRSVASQLHGSLIAARPQLGSAIVRRPERPKRPKDGIA